VEKRVDEPSGHGEERRQLGLEKVVVVFVFSRRELKVLLNLLYSATCFIFEGGVTHSEEILLILQALLLLLPQLVQAVVVPVIVDELVVPLDAALADLLANVVELLARLDDAGVDELELGREGFCGQRGIEEKVVVACKRRSSKSESSECGRSRMRKSNLISPKPDHHRSRLTSHLLHQRLIHNDVLDSDLRLGEFGREIVLCSKWGEQSRERVAKCRAGREQGCEASASALCY
jgi:hypothetical protein